MQIQKKFTTQMEITSRQSVPPSHWVSFLQKTIRTVQLGAEIGAESRIPGFISELAGRFANAAERKNAWANRLKRENSFGGNKTQDRLFRLPGRPGMTKSVTY